MLKSFQANTLNRIGAGDVAIALIWGLAAFTFTFGMCALANYRMGL